MTRLTIDDNYIVAVKSNVDGTLVFDEHGYNERWYDVGEIVEMPWSEVKDIRKYQRKFFENNWIILEKTAEYTAAQLYDALGVSKYYPNGDKFKDVDIVLSMKPKEIADYLKDKGQEYKDTLATYAKRRYEENDPRMDSKSKIDALGRILNVNFDEVN